jgi:pimeloyl-ACP methyl ester carboxylesterase
MAEVQSKKTNPKVSLKKIGFILGGIVLIILVTVLALPFIWPLPLEGKLKTNRQVATEYAQDGEFITVNGYSTYVIDKNKDSQKVIVFVHGFGASAETWRTHLDYFVQKGYRAIALDLKGFGFSDRDWNSSYSHKSQADLIAGILEQKQIPKAVFIGHSMGVSVLLNYVNKYADSVIGYVFIDGANIVNNTNSPLPTSLIGNPYIKRVARHYVQNTFSLSSFDDLLKSALFVDNIVTEDYKKQYVYPLQINNWDEGLLAVTRDSQENAVSDDSIKKITQPTIIIWGKQDEWIPVEKGIAFAEKIPQSQLYVIPEVGHLPMDESPKLFRAIVEEFLSKLPF